MERSSSIKRKLITAMMLTSVIVLFLTAVLTMTYEMIAFKQTLRENLASLAQIVAANNTANMIYQGQHDAEEILNSLRADPQILRAALYDTNRHLFAWYPRSASRQTFPDHPRPDGTYFARSTLSIFRPVMVVGRPVLGTLYIEMSLDSLYHRIRQGVQNMGRLVDDLLNLARVGRQELIAQMTGFNTLVEEVLDELRSETENRTVEWRIGPLPVVVMTSSKQQKDMVEGYQLGVNSYIQKPVNFDQFREIIKDLGFYWLVINQSPPPAAFQPRKVENKG